MTRPAAPAFTPGPWKVRKSEVLAPASGSTVATVWEGALAHEPNARLIAAAPTMYETLVAYLNGEDISGRVNDLMGALNGNT